MDVDRRKFFASVGGAAAVAASSFDPAGRSAAIATLLCPDIASSATTLPPNFAAARKSIATLATRHEIPYADFWAAPSDDRQFSNSDHLNDAGARRLAPMIIRACEKPVQATGSNRQ